MRIPYQQRPVSLLLSLLILLVSVVHASSEDLRYNIGYLPVSSSSKPTTLGVILGKAVPRRSHDDPEKFVTHYIWSLESYSAPRKDSEEYARVGLLDDAGKGFKSSSSLASFAALVEPERHDAELYVQLNAEGRPQSVAIRQVERPEGKSEGKNVGQPRLLVMSAAPESKAILKQPVVLNAEGKLEEPPKEKTLLQRYWWVGAVFLAVTLMQGGDDSK